MSKRESPINMGIKPATIDEVNGWQVALTYVGEIFPASPTIVDLSHISKLNVQGHDLHRRKVKGLSFPSEPGDVRIGNGAILVRLSPTEAQVLVVEDMPTVLDGFHTDVTDAYAAFAFIGSHCLEVLSKLSDVDLAPRHRTFSLAAQAPVEGIVCLLIRLNGREQQPGLLVACPRGYGQFLFDTFMDAGLEYDLAVGGWARFKDWQSGSGLLFDHSKKEP